MFRLTLAPRRAPILIVAMLWSSAGVTEPGAAAALTGLPVYSETEAAEAAVSVRTPLARTAAPVAGASLMSGPAPAAVVDIHGQIDYLTKRLNAADKRIAGLEKDLARLRGHRHRR